MKRLLHFPVFLALLSGSITLNAQDFFVKADTFFARYVVDGKVSYSRLKAERGLLDSLVQDIASFTYTGVDKNVMKAFYINAFNILAIRQVVDHYPTEGPMKIHGFFNHITHSVAGTTMSLDKLEKEVLYPNYMDPKLYFVLVCAAKGFPPLASFSYHPSLLNQQMTDRTRAVLSMPSYIQVSGKEVKLPMIFTWNEEDFIVRSPTVIGFINTFRTEKLAENARVSFYDFDWTLNE